MLPMMANTAAPNGPDLSQTVTKVRPLSPVTTQQRGICDTEMLTDTARRSDAQHSIHHPLGSMYACPAWHWEPAVADVSQGEGKGRSTLTEGKISPLPVTFCYCHHQPQHHPPDVKSKLTVRQGRSGGDSKLYPALFVTPNLPWLPASA